MNAKREELLGLSIGATIKREQMEYLLGNIPLQSEFTICIGTQRVDSVFRSFKKHHAEGLEGWEVVR